MKELLHEHWLGPIPELPIKVDNIPAIEMGLSVGGKNKEDHTRELPLYQIDNVCHHHSHYTAQE